MLLLVRLVAPGALTFLATPFWKAGTGLTHAVGGTGSFFADKGALVNERDRLLLENAALTNENATLAAKAADLEKLLGTRTEPARGVLLRCWCAHRRAL